MRARIYSPPFLHGDIGEVVKWRLLDRLVTFLPFFLSLSFRVVVFLDDVGTSSLQSRMPVSCLSVLRTLSMSESVGRRRRRRLGFPVKEWRGTHGNVRMRVHVSAQVGASDHAPRGSVAVS